MTVEYEAINETSINTPAPLVRLRLHCGRRMEDQRKSGMRGAITPPSEQATVVVQLSSRQL